MSGIDDDIRRRITALADLSFADTPRFWFRCPCGEEGIISIPGRMLDRLSRDGTLDSAIHNAQPNCHKCGCKAWKRIGEPTEIALFNEEIRTEAHRVLNELGERGKRYF